MSQEQITDNKLEEIKKVFSDFLEHNKQRKTTERFAILEEIYRYDGHFEAEELFLLMRNQQHNVSRATVYNTLDLLVNCGLVKKHLFGRNIAQYEKSYGYRQHDHLICLDCRRVVEFCDPRIHGIKTMMGDLLHFTITEHALTLYGHCNGACEKTEDGDND